MADGSLHTPRQSRFANSRELLTSASPHDAYIMNVERSVEDHTALIAYPRGFYVITDHDGGCVELNDSTARLMAEAILRDIAVRKAVA